MIIVAVSNALKPYESEVRFSVLWIILAISASIGGLIYGWVEYEMHNRIFKRIFEKNRSLQSLCSKYRVGR